MVDVSALPSWLNATRHSRAAIVVAHPDDETLWCGGLILSHLEWPWQVVTLCRASDPDRAGKFNNVMRRYGSVGHMGDLDDEPEQSPLSQTQVRKTIADLLPAQQYDVVLTHGPMGEYTRHRRHEECCRAVVAMWQAGEISARELWLFAYDDDGGDCLPHVQEQATRRIALNGGIWNEKRRILVELYGFAIDSWEAQVTPRVEGFFCFNRPADAACHIPVAEAAP